MRRKRQIPYPLSAETEPHYDQALAKVQESKTQKNGEVVEVLKGDDGQGNPIGIIVVEEDV